MSPKIDPFNYDNKIIYISFLESITENTVDKLIMDLIDYKSQGIKHIYFLFSSSGGNVACGIYLYNFLYTLQTAGVKITMHNMGNVASIAVPIFLAANERHACPNTTFLFHSVTYPPKPNIDYNEASTLFNSITVDNNNIKNILLNKTSFSSEEIDNFFTKETLINADVAKSKKIIEEIKEVKLDKSSLLVQFKAPKTPQFIQQGIPIITN